MVQVSIVSIVCAKKKRTTNGPDTDGKRKCYAEILDHQYLPQYVIIMVDIWNRFRNIQGLKWYWFLLFLSCVKKIADKKWFRYRWRKKTIMERSATINTTHNKSIGHYSSQLQMANFNNNNII